MGGFVLALDQMNCVKSWSLATGIPGGICQRTVSARTWCCRGQVHFGHDFEKQSKVWSVYRGVPLWAMGAIELAGLDEAARRLPERYARPFQRAAELARGRLS